MTDEDRGASRAEPPASPRLALWVGAVVVALVLGGFVLSLAGPRRTKVPDGIAGVSLGSTLDEARRALPELAEVVPATVASPPAPASYPVYRARSVLFDEPATCTVELAVATRVSRVECVLDASPGVEHEARVRGKLLTTLRELYGKESQTGQSSWLWQNERARLLLATTPRASLSVWSGAHEAALRLDPPGIAADH